MKPILMKIDLSQVTDKGIEMPLLTVSEAMRMHVKGFDVEVHNRKTIIIFPS